ncbi:MAG: hypothetical protein NT145_00945, partial [Elusimicrobia bacterium]|nr:hypothetical protein [Elusimicrobiota bacterium]
MRLFIKTTAVFTAACFLFTCTSSSVHAAIALAQETAAENALANSSFLPAETGNITDAKFFDSKKIVINIQDLHCNPEAQKNISRVLSFFNEKYHFKKILVEGGIGKVDTSWIEAVSDISLRKKIINA